MCDCLFKKLGEEDWKKVIDVNLYSVYNIILVVLMYFLEFEGGCVINILLIIG